MGLTIHYSLATSLTDTDNVRTLVTSMQETACKFPFKSVSVVKEFVGDDADFEQSRKDDHDRWLKIQAGRFLEVEKYSFKVKPSHIIGFTIVLGDGCEPANFGFCRLPTRIEMNMAGRTRRVPTNLAGWSWQSFCKTQYASDRRCGGIQNFLRCHVGLCKFLEWAEATKLMNVKVSDESGYFEHRDPKALVNTVGEWNEFIAAFAGMFKDQAEESGIEVESAIARFPDFEHLEARGLDKLRNPRRGSE